VKLGGRKDGKQQDVCPYLSPECGERGLNNEGCSYGGYFRKCIEEEQESSQGGNKNGKSKRKA